MAEIPTPTTGYTTPGKKRPLGVTILAILLILGGALNLIGTPVNLFYGAFYAGFYAMLAIIDLIIGIALFQMIPWSRMAAIIMQLIGLTLGLILTVWAGSIFEAIIPGATMLLLVSMVPSLIISLVVIIYLMQGSIKAAFEGTQW
ncbi:MAG: hypothetical protein ACXABX_08975 [Candidatus Thorarchaeota archaeon]|jgi:hypothetical protein